MSRLLARLLLSNRTAALLGAAILTGCGGGAPTDASSPEPRPLAATSTGDARAAATDAVTRETARINEWFEARFEEELDFSPLTKTFRGRKDDYDQVDDFSEAAMERELAWQRDTVADMRARFDYELLSPEARTSYDLWIYRFEQAEAAMPFRRREYIFHQMDGPHTGLPQFLINFHGVDDESDMRAYVTRIRETGRAIGQLLERARLAAGEGVHAPRFAYEAVLTQSRALLEGAPFDHGPGSNSSEAAAGSDAAIAEAAPSLSPLWADATAKIDALLERGEINAQRAASLRSATEAALIESFEPAYEALIAWVESELPNADEIATGVWKLPDGAAYYEERLRNQTTSDLTAAEIHALGRNEVARLQAEMEAVKEETGFEGSLQEFFTFVRNDPQFYFPNTDEGRQAYLDGAREHLALIEERLPRYFGLLPKADLVVRRVEAYREQPGAPQHYRAPTPDGSRPGIYYAHLIDMRAVPIPQMEVIAYHEGLPGHHMQIAIGLELTGVPTFRAQGGYTAFTEGWGLYSEWLAVEMGAYTDPYSDFGRLSSEIWRAIRLVIDTGLHAEGWTEAEAIEYFATNSPAPDGQIRAEVGRYIVMPGQATSYKIGMLKIQELRRRAEARLGDAFDIRGYHDTVLGGGALPLAILERRVDTWIAAQLAATE